MRRWLAVLIGALGLYDLAGAEERGPVGVATSMQVSAALEQGEAEHAMLVILRLDTPGGLVNATRELILSILATSIPVAVYVVRCGAGDRAPGP